MSCLLQVQYCKTSNLNSLSVIERRTLKFLYLSGIETIVRGQNSRVDADFVARAKKRLWREMSTEEQPSRIPSEIAVGHLTFAISYFKHCQANGRSPDKQDATKLSQFFGCPASHFQQVINFLKDVQSKKRTYLSPADLFQLAPMGHPVNIMGKTTDSLASEMAITSTFPNLCETEKVAESLLSDEHFHIPDEQNNPGPSSSSQLNNGAEQSLPFSRYTCVEPIHYPISIDTEFDLSEFRSSSVNFITSGNCENYVKIVITDFDNCTLEDSDSNTDSDSDNTSND